MLMRTCSSAGMRTLTQTNTKKAHPRRRSRSDRSIPRSAAAQTGGPVCLDFLSRLTTKTGAQRMSPAFQLIPALASCCTCLGEIINIFNFSSQTPNSCFQLSAGDQDVSVADEGNAHIK